MTDMTETIEQRITCSVQPRPDGSTKFVFVLLPSGQVVGELRLESANPEILQVMASTFAQWAQQQHSGIQIAPGLAGVDKYQAAVNKMRANGAS